MNAGRRGRLVRGHVVRWGSGGDARVELADGGSLWARGVVPGDEATFRIREGGPRVHGDLVSLEKPSEHRVPAPCSHAETCGGCPWMVVSDEYARQSKLEWVTRAVGGVVTVLWHAAPSRVGYRRRARLAFDSRQGRLSVGYRQARGHGIASIDACMVLEPILASALVLLQNTLGQADGPGEIRLAIGARGLAIAAIRASRPQPSAFYRALESLVRADRFAGISLAVVEGSATGAAVFGDPGEQTPCGDGRPLHGTADGFSQANDAVALEMANVVTAWAEPVGARVLELYAGHGHLTMGLAAAALSLTTVEASSEATAALLTNLETRGYLATVIAGDAAGAPNSRVDVVVLDPPRTGAEAALSCVIAACPSRIIMVSCDPRTLARDLRRLEAGGYDITRAAAFDMFPGTAHVESVVRLDRRV